jgi:molybdopterin converting factor small subunit
MARVIFAAHLQRHLPRPDMQVPGRTVREVMSAIFAPDPLLRNYVLDDQGRLRKHVNIYLNGQRIADRTGLSDAVGERDEIHVFQALSGG